MHKGGRQSNLYQKLKKAHNISKIFLFLINMSVFQVKQVYKLLDYLFFKHFVNYNL